MLVMVLQMVAEALGVFFHTNYYFYAILALFSLVLVFTTKRWKVFIAALVFAYLIGSALQVAYGQPRPCVFNPGAVACPDEGGFPSVHAAVSVVFVIASLGTPLFWFFLVFAGIVSLSRMWIGVHSWEQVVAGLVLGVTIYLVVFELERKLFHKKTDWPDAAKPSLLGKKKGILSTQKETGIFELDE